MKLYTVNQLTDGALRVSLAELALSVVIIDCSNQRQPERQECTTYPFFTYCCYAGFTFWSMGNRVNYFFTCTMCPVTFVN
jgi:hypothetical protein